MQKQKHFLLFRPCRLEFLTTLTKIAFCMVIFTEVERTVIQFLTSIYYCCSRLNCLSSLVSVAFSWDPLLTDSLLPSHIHLSHT